jgi:predicted outer membrane lipoprotein
MAGPITGNRGAFPQPNRWGRNETGNWSQVSYEGTKPEIFLLAAAFGATEGLAYEVTEQFGKWRLDVHLPWSVNGIDPRTDRVDNWEFFAQHAEKDLLEAAVETAAIRALTDNQISTIRALLEVPPNPTAVPPDPIVTDEDFGGGDSGLNAYEVYRLMLKGARSFPIEQPMLRHTITTSNQYAVAYALLNVRKIVSSATVVGTENIPRAILFTLPFEVSSNSDYAYGWYKMFPTVQQIALLKWQIVQEYQYGLWATLIWGNPL